jgi:hypothetical protein
MADLGAARVAALYILGKICDLPLADWLNPFNLVARK